MCELGMKQGQELPLPRRLLALRPRWLQTRCLLDMRQCAIAQTVHSGARILVGRMCGECAQCITSQKRKLMNHCEKL